MEFLPLYFYPTYTAEGTKHFDTREYQSACKCMKICIINSLYKPYTRGGAETVVEVVTDGLLKKGHEVVLITLGRKKEREVLDNVIVHRIRPYNIFSFLDISKHSTIFRMIWHVLDIFNFFGANQVKKILEKEKVEIVMTHNLKGVGYLIPRAIKKLGIKHIHTLHDLQLSRPSGLMIYDREKPFLIMDKVYEHICRFLFNSPDVVISPSAWLLNFYAIRGFFPNSKKVVLQNPVEQVNEKASKHDKKNTEDVNFLYLGQLERSKGILFLIDTFKELEKKNWKLRIVGAGNSENVVKNKIKSDDRFLFYGFVKRAKLSNIFGQTDCTIIPSLCYENSPTVIYESFVSGVPVIASDIGGIPELVKDNVNGFTFEPGNKENLKKVLIFYLEHPEKIKELQSNTRKSIQNYTTEKYLEKILSL